MAFLATDIWEVRTDGADTNGAGFNTAAPTLTDGAATSATGNSPVFTSASYNFVAGDVGAWVYIKSGTNWTPGWYQIASVAANAATLKAAVGEASLVGSTTLKAGPNATAGCATTASPTGATWSVDYSQQAAAVIAVTDAVTNGTTTITSATAAFPASCVGNYVYVTGGTGSITAAWYRVVTRTSATAIVVDRSTGLTTGTGVTLNLGGALLTIAAALTLSTIDQMAVWVRAGTYTITTALTPPARGAPTRNPWRGYGSVRGDGTRPVISVTAAVDGITMNTGWSLENFEVDGTGTGLVGLSNAAGSNNVWNCKVRRFTSTGINASGSYITVALCEVTGCVAGIILAGYNGAEMCWVHDNTGVGVTLSPGSKIVASVVVHNSGGTSDGVVTAIASCLVWGNVIVANGRDGIRMAVADTARGGAIVHNNILASNAGYGLNLTSAPTHGDIPWLNYNAAWNNTLGARNNVNPSPNTVTLSGDPFTFATIFTDLAIDGSDNTKMTSAAFPFTSAHIGQTVTITGGGGFTVQTVTITSIDGVKAVCSAALGTVGSTGGLGHGNDYTLNNTAGAGAACRGAGFPGVLPGL